MSYYIQVFSPKTYEAFTQSQMVSTGFRPSRQKAASNVVVGDKFICYLTRLSRWVGVLEVKSHYFCDDSPIFGPGSPYTLRFQTSPVAWLVKERSIPIHEDKVWNQLSFTKGISKNSATWTGIFRMSLNRLSEEDGIFLENLIKESFNSESTYTWDEQTFLKELIDLKVSSPEGDISVTVPEEGDGLEDVSSNSAESTQIQAKLAAVGQTMGFDIWITKNDRQKVLSAVPNASYQLVEKLPLNYNEATIRTIEQIDVLWLKNRTIVRAFEVEHTTPIYSGLLRMADLLSLQPNISIKLHIVAPDDRRDQVFRQINRPVFSYLPIPLQRTCTFISYGSLGKLAELPYLNHMTDSILDEDEYSEEVGED